jgi:hypothetical protein
MDGSRFDAWTRRRFGMATGAVLLGVSVLVDAEAKNKNRKKKKKRRRRRRRQEQCLILRTPCTPGAEPACCSGLLCSQVGLDSIIQTFCCNTEGNPCSLETDCCAGLGCASGVCRRQMISDRHLKTNFATVDASDMLARVRALPISTWNYATDDPTIRHIGPMAQDFAAQFGVGADDRHLHPVDGHGVALAAIQGLLAELEAVRNEYARLAARLDALEQDA